MTNTTASAPSKAPQAAKPPGRFTLFSGMTLRWRLVIAFLSVSTFPVLMASLVVADLIAGLFSENMEHWLQDASLFVTERLIDEQGDAKQAVTIIAASLCNDADTLETKIMEISTNLLTSVGYDAVAIYDEAGHILYSHGAIGDGHWLPRSHQGRFFVLNDQDHPILLLGAVKRFRRNGQTYHIFVGDRRDGTMVNMGDTNPSLRVQVFAVNDGKVSTLNGSGSGSEAVQLPNGVLAKLAAGTPSVTAKMFATDSMATAFAALRDNDGKLVGVVACRMADQVTMLSHVRTLELFVLLSGIAGALSLVVALSLSKLISRPLSRLTQALRRVHEGDYSTRVTVEGGYELAQLATGFNDMTEQLETLRCRETLVRRREKLAVLGEAAAVMAHEIRNPLGIIKTSSQVLRMKFALPQASERLVSFVLDEVGRIEKLVQELLDYAQPKTIARLPVDIGAELSAVLEFTAPELAQRRIAVQAVWPTGKAVAMGDGTRLHQAFLNILLNAMDAMPEGGTLTVSVAREDGQIVIGIGDTGAGVAAEVQDRIFDPFVTTKPRGTGLGLARVRDVMEQHGGSIHFDSVPGVGTIFTLRLPMVPGSEGDPR